MWEMRVFFSNLENIKKWANFFILRPLNPITTKYFFSKTTKIFNKNLDKDLGQKLSFSFMKNWSISSFAEV